MSFNTDALKKLLKREIVTSDAEKVLLEKKSNLSITDIHNTIHEFEGYLRLCVVLETLEWLKNEVDNIEKTGEEM